MSDRDSINRLRAIAARLIERDDLDSAWFAEHLAEYIAGARHGRTLGDAFQLTVSHGARPWWMLEAIEARAVLLRALHRRHFPALDGRPAAAAIAAALSRYRSTAWQRDRAFVTPPRDPLKAALFYLLKLEVPLSASTIRRALGAGSREQSSREPALPAA